MFRVNAIDLAISHRSTMALSRNSTFVLQQRAKRIRFDFIFHLRLFLSFFYCYYQSSLLLLFLLQLFSFYVRDKKKKVTAADGLKTEKRDTDGSFFLADKSPEEIEFVICFVLDRFILRV